MNKSLGMSPGKLAAQAAHAVMSIPRDRNGPWIGKPHRTILVMESKDESTLKNTQIYLKDRGIMSYEVIDEGVNEIDPHVVTALATEVLDKDNLEVKQTLSSFKLYREKIKITMEVDI